MELDINFIQLLVELIVKSQTPNRHHHTSFQRDASEVNIRSPSSCVRVHASKHSQDALCESAIEIRHKCTS
jgi:hypothetical protein